MSGCSGACIYLCSWSLCVYLSVCDFVCGYGMCAVGVVHMHLHMCLWVVLCVAGVVGVFVWVE